MPRMLSSLWLVLVCLAGLPAASAAQTAANVLVVANEASPESLEIAAYYASQRGISDTQVLRIRTAVTEEIQRRTFDAEIQNPIGGWLARHAAQDRILYIVLTKGVPLRIAGTRGRVGTMASVDSELALLYRRMTGQQVALGGPVPNPYFRETLPDELPRFSHRDFDIYLVSRLDGFSVADVRGLIDRGLKPSTAGRVLLDQRATLGDPANQWLADAAERLKARGHGDRVVLETTSRALVGERDVLGYYSWGSNDPELRRRHPDLGFVPGAIAASYVSTDGRTFAEPPANWVPGDWSARERYFAGSPQSLAGDLIRSGVTGLAAQVAEPFIDAAIRPDVLFPAYLSGATLVEAFYLAMPSLGWQTIVIGDPLCAPFPREPLATTELDPPLDPATELPSYFAARRLAHVALAGDKDAIALLVRSDSRRARGDTAGALEALEQAVARDASLVSGWRALGMLYDDAGEREKAVHAYRQVLERDPKDIIALNNLAYAIGVREHRPAEALPLAERAYLLSKGSPVIADTLGWIRHLMGDHAEAAKLLQQAVKGAPNHPDIRLHAAVVFAAVGRLDDARRELEAAEKLEPKIVERPEYEDARRRIAGQ